MPTTYYVKMNLLYWMLRKKKYLVKKKITQNISNKRDILRKESIHKIQYTIKLSNSERHMHGLRFRIVCAWTNAVNTQKRCKFVDLLSKIVATEVFV